MYEARSAHISSGLRLKALWGSVVLESNLLILKNASGAIIDSAPIADAEIHSNWFTLYGSLRIKLNGNRYSVDFTDPTPSLSVLVFSTLRNRIYTKRVIRELMCEVAKEAGD